MATAQKTTIEVPVTTVTTKDVITLTLSQDEAHALCRIMGYTLGKGKLRKVVNSVFHELCPLVTEYWDPSPEPHSPWEGLLLPRLRDE